MRKIVSSVVASRAQLASVMALILVDCASGPSGSDSIPPTPDVGTYKIGIPDLHAVTVWEQPDLSGKVLVRRDGKISVPLMGDVVAAGQTPEGLARKIERGLSRYVASPRVDVAVV